MDLGALQDSKWTVGIELVEPVANFWKMHLQDGLRSDYRLTVETAAGLRREPRFFLLAIF